MEKSFSKQNEDKRLGQTLYFCGLVFRGTLAEFESVRDFLLKWTEAKLIFQTRSPDYLQIVRAPPKNRQEVPEA